MNKVLIILISVIVLLLSFVFFKNTAQESDGGGLGVENLPKEVPENLKISYSTDGGMLPKWERIFISKDSCYREISEHQVKNKYYFNLTEKELENLYQTLRKNNFGSIKIREEKEVYDRGGTSLDISWKGGSVEKSNSGLSFVEKRWIGNYSACVGAVTSIAKQKLDEVAHSVKIFVENTDPNPEHFFNVHIDELNFSYTSEKQGNSYSKELKILDGAYHFNAYAFERLENSKINYLDDNDLEAVLVKKETKSIKFSWNGAELKVNIQ